MWDLTYALAEEIGDPDLFVGRKKEMMRLLKWADGTKRRISKSMGILSRRKKGKTALLQRFFNILYTQNDPQLIPYYYRIPEERLFKSVFAKRFYQRLLTQYFAFTTRTPELVAKVLPMGELKELAARDRHVKPPGTEVWRRNTRSVTACRRRPSPEPTWPKSSLGIHRRRGSPSWAVSAPSARRTSTSTKRATWKRTSTPSVNATTART